MLLVSDNTAICTQPLSGQLALLSWVGGAGRVWKLRKVLVLHRKGTVKGEQWVTLARKCLFQRSSGNSWGEVVENEGKSQGAESWSQVVPSVQIGAKKLLKDHSAFIYTLAVGCHVVPPAYQPVCLVCLGCLVFSGLEQLVHGVYLGTLCGWPISSFIRSLQGRSCA